ncbi:MAG: hypothetical protein QOD89_1816 [Bradyrhizobium sp.]|nr:hypothetical protein [Bradyrhizobium sp.]
MSEFAAGFLKFAAYRLRNNKKRGGIVSSQDNQFFAEPAFTPEDILWALGVWSVILALSPVIVFYFLMVN